MITLAFEFSTDLRTVAVLRDGVVLSEAEHARSRHTPVFELVARALEQAGVDRAAVGTLVVGLGPGSYTGVRIAISAVQGWCLARECRVVGVSSFAALARRVPAGETVWIAADAQREEFAVAPASDGRLTGPTTLVSLAELRSWIASGRRVVGPDVAARLGIGTECEWFPRASDLGRIASESTDCIAPELLAPVYLREAAFLKAGPVREVPELVRNAAEAGR